MKKTSIKMKLLFFVFIFTSVLLIYTNAAQASPENKDIFKSRFSGSIVMEDRHFDTLYWYIDPQAQEKYLLKDGVTLSRLIKNISIGISNENLNKLPSIDTENNVDWNITNRLKGQFLLQVENNGQVWYLNPLDQKTYKIANGKDGLDTLKNLALELDTEQLSLFETNDNLKTKITAMPEVDFSIYWDVWNRLKMDHLNSASSTDIERFYDSLKGMTEGMNDPYTQFFTPQNNELFQGSLDGSIEGIGAIVDVVDGIFTIVSPLKDSPAEKAGLQANDQVLSVDGVDIRNFKIDDSIYLVRGPKGTTVKLEIHRPKTKKTFFVSVKRDVIDIPFVEYEKLENNIAYIKINMFSDDMIDEFDIAKEAVIDNKTKGIIIDLRNNPGGYTSIVRKLSDFWLSPGDKIYSEKYSNYSHIYTAYSKPEINMPTIILTNQGTASASEIFTAALREHGLAQVVGDTTFGKGTGQALENFSDGSALKYTVFEWLTPMNNSIQDVGIKPDYFVENNEKSDLQLLKAQNLLK